jgi:hypothetical protein
MTEPAIITNLINAGAGGLIIVVVVLFLKFLSDERARASDLNTAMMGFIKEQREGNNSANAEAAKLIADAQTKAAELVAAAQIKAADQIAQAQTKAAEQTASTYVQVAEAMASLASEIRLLRDVQEAHDIATQAVLTKLKSVRARAPRNKGTPA